MAHPVTPNFPSLASLIQACKSGLERLPYFCLIVGLALPASALTLHRSFRTREAGFGFGKATITYPVDAKVDKSLDEAAEKDVAKTKVIIDRCTRVSDGDTRHVATGNAHHYAHFDHTPAYAAAETAAKEKKLGLWGGGNPMRPYEWRRSKRKM